MQRTLLIDTLPWQPVRPALTHGVEGKTLRDGPTKVVLTRVLPGGSFKRHRDPYAHLFVCLEGRGRVSVEGQDYDVTAGTVVEVAAGEEHAYSNTGGEPLLLISMNLPVSEGTP